MSKKHIRKFVTDRARGCCEYCMSQEMYSSQAFSLEHINPTALGGEDDVENLALSCQGCNNSKYIKVVAFDPITGLNVRLFNPRIDKWVEHFRWNENFTVIIGITPIGRATANTLKMNRDFLINQRIVYRFYGVHPPEHTML